MIVRSCRFFWILLLLTAFNSCQPDNDPEIEPTDPPTDLEYVCEPLPIFTPELRLQPYTHIGNRYATPTFSPLDSNMIAMEKYSGYLLIYDIGKQELVYESEDLGFITGKPDWGENNIICFPNLQSDLVYFLDIDGFTLTRVSLGSTKYTEWLNDSTIIFFQDGGRYGWHLLTYNYFSGEVATLVADAGNLLTSTDSYNKKYGKILIATEANMAYYNIFTNTFHDGPYSGSTEKPLFSVWHPRGDRVYYLKSSGFYYYDYTTESEHSIKESCDTRYYHSFDISKDGNTVIAELHQQWIDKAPEAHQYEEINGMWNYYNTHIVTFGLDGSNEKIVLEGVLDK